MAKSFWINSNALMYMEQLSNDANYVETGGILMGYIGKNEEAVVTIAIGSGTNATHSRHHFIPDDDYHKEAMDKVYNESDCNITYLGDWHSHPEGGATLSLKDRITLGRIGNAHSPYGSLPFMLVLAREALNKPLNRDNI